MRRTILLLLAAALACVAVPAVAAPVATPAPCPGGIQKADRARVDCGYINVPLRYDGSAPEIQIAYARIRAANPGATDATLMLAGGPGQKLVRHIGLIARDTDGTKRLARNRDLVLIDQRGVGRSSPSLTCTGGDPKAKPPAALRRCADELRAKGIDLGAFNTLNSVRDLDQVRQALGYSQLNLYGASYGARLAQQALRGSPGWVRSVALSSPVPAEANWVADAGSSFAAAVARTFADCARRRPCGTDYPRMSARLERLITRLERRPATVRVPGRRGTVRVAMKASDLSHVLFSAYYQPLGWAFAAVLVDALDRGDDQMVRDTLTLLAGAGSGSDAGITDGVYINSLCQEEAAYRPVASPSGRLPSVARVLVRSDPVFGNLGALCQAWGVPPGDPLTFEPVTATTPAIIFAGRYDQVTPPRYGITVSRQLTGSVLVKVPGVGHSPAEAAGTCGMGILARFIDEPGRAPDLGCIRRGEHLREGLMRLLLG
ncbi:MAG: alpha/beta fold hydrolase [Thermoleophilia bacterium]